MNTKKDKEWVSAIGSNVVEFKDVPDIIVLLLFVVFW